MNFSNENSNENSNDNENNNEYQDIDILPSIKQKNNTIKMNEIKENINEKNITKQINKKKEINTINDISMSKNQNIHIINDRNNVNKSKLDECNNDAQRRALLKLKGQRLPTPPDPNTLQPAKDNFLQNKEKAILCNIENNNNNYQNIKRRKKKRKNLFENDINDTNINNNDNIENVEPLAKKRRIVSLDGSVMSNERIKQLINAKPLNAENLKEEKLDKLYFETSILEEQEKANNSLNEITNVNVKLFFCQNSKCQVVSKLFESKPHFICNQHLSMVKESYGIKYFWQCPKCKDKSHTYNMKHNMSKCQKCGNSELIPASAYNIRQKKSKDQSLQITSNQTELRSRF